MKKKSFVLLLTVSIVTMLTGCSQQSNTTTETNSSSNTGNNTITEPTTISDISGIVKSMTGNQFVIAVLNMGDMKGQMENQESEAPDGEDSEESVALSFGGNTMGGGPGMGSGPGGDRPEGGPDGMGEKGDKDSMIQEMLKNSTESKTVTIPVGIQMIKKSGPGNSTEGAEEVTLEDLAVGSMLQIWLDDSITDRNVAEFVTLQN